MTRLWNVPYGYHSFWMKLVPTVSMIWVALIFVSHMNVALSLVAMLSTTIKLRHVHDNFRIKLELKLTFLFIITTATIGVFPRTLAGLCFIDNIFVAIWIDMPVVLSYTHVRNRARLKHKPAVNATLFEVRFHTFLKLCIRSRFR